MTCLYCLAAGEIPNSCKKKFSNATISGEFGIAKKNMGKTGIPDAVRATNRILSICFCYCPGNVLDKSRHCIGLL